MHTKKLKSVARRKSNPSTSIEKQTMTIEEFEKYIERQGVSIPEDSLQVYFDLYTKMEVGKHYDFRADDFATADHLHSWNVLGKMIYPVIKGGLFKGNEHKFFRV